MLRGNSISIVLAVTLLLVAVAFSYDHMRMRTIIRELQDENEVLENEARRQTMVANETVKQAQRFVESLQRKD